MACVVVVGSQWGDEGKGKIVDLLTEHADAVVRYQGGANAGHTVMFEDRTFILHLIPSGILRGKPSILGNGVVVDVASLAQEIDNLRKAGIVVEDTLKVSDRAHVVMPWHKTFDRLREVLRGTNKLGTTGRGIGPTYADKVGRAGLRVGDLGDAADLRSKLEFLIAEKNRLLTNFEADEPPFELEPVLEECQRQYEMIQAYVVDSSILVNDMIDDGKHLLFEGAQGTFLDVDHGTYPFVTSSNTLAGGVCTGCGIGPTRITDVVGIVKAYTTRVGTGPFPTELFDETGEFLRKEGREFGATTGRPRRCGWFDAVLVRQAVRLNGITSLAVTKLDVLDALETLRIATGYRIPSGEIVATLPSRNVEAVEPTYEEMPGWQCPTVGIATVEELPAAMRAYLDRLSELVGAPVSIISTGPRREETIVLDSANFWQ